MKTLILSDLHDDFWAEAKRDPFEPCADILQGLEAIVLAGDITNKPRVRWKLAFTRLRDRFGAIPIHVIPGNHDFYDWRIDCEERLAGFAAPHDVHYAQAKTIHLGRTRLICATLWTDFELGDGLHHNEVFVPSRMNDYRYIRHEAGGYRRARPADTIKIHHEHRHFIERALAAPHDGLTFVVTHHAPHPGVLRHYGEGLDAAYASDLSEIIEGSNRPDRWLFGHSHDSRDLDLNGCALRCVSLGYPDDVATNDEIRRRVSRAIFDL
jgi:predicted phosphodiesterase